MSMPAVAVGVGGGADQQGCCGEGKEQQALHWLERTALSLWVFSLFGIHCCGVLTSSVRWVGEIGLCSWLAPDANPANGVH
jgi:hypothetical protein